MRARIVGRSANVTTVELSLELEIHDNGNDAMANIFLADDDIEDTPDAEYYIGGTGLKDGLLVATENSGLFLPDHEASPQASRALIVAVVNAINAALAGSNAPGGKS